MKLLVFDDLKPLKGIHYSRVQLWRMEKTGQFPKRIKLGRGGRFAWPEHEIDGWIRAQIKARDKATEAA